jgi:hypothetical protein
MEPHLIEVRDLNIVILHVTNDFIALLAAGMYFLIG